VSGRVNFCVNFHERNPFCRFKEEEKNVAKLGRCNFLFSMATCHSLTIIDNEITGDPLDQKMFEATQWVCNADSCISLLDPPFSVAR
jgi:magnesium-transporting ATPase (P-type)